MPAPTRRAAAIVVGVLARDITDETRRLINLRDAEELESGSSP